MLAVTVAATIENPTAVAESPTERLVYVLTRDESADFLAVKFELSGDAIYEVDYTVREAENDTIWLPGDPPSVGPVAGTATFYPGESIVELIVVPRNDSIAETDESVILTIVEVDQFGVTYGGTSLIDDDEDTQYFLSDEENRLATVDVETGCVHVLGTIDALPILTDITFTHDGRLLGISTDRLFEIFPDEVDAGVIPTDFIGFHGVPGANALIDARDGDFGSGAGDLFAVGEDFLELALIDMELDDGTWFINDTISVFDIDDTLQAQLMPHRFVSSGDLDYLSGGSLALSASGFDEFGVFDEFDSLIEIETPGTDGIIDRAPWPAEDPGESFDDLFGFAFDGNDSYAFAGHTLLSVGQFSLNTSREIEMTGRLYEIGTPSVATGLIIGDLVKQNTIGLYQPDASLFHLKESFTPGLSDIYFAFGPGGAGWTPLSGDWNGDGIDTIGFYQPDISLFHLKDTFTPGASDQYFAFGPGGFAGWIPIAGDWNGDGIDTIGLYQPDISLFHLKDSFTPGASDQYFAFGPGGAGWIPLAGDWNGDGIDTIGLYQPDISLFHLKDSFTPGPSDYYFAFGPGGSAGWTPLTGDWDGDGDDTVGFYQGDVSLFHLKDTFTPGASDQYFAFGPGGSAGWIPLSGDWNGPGTTSLSVPFVASSLSASVAPEAEWIDESELSVGPSAAVKQVSVAEVNIQSRSRPSSSEPSVGKTSLGETDGPSIELLDQALTDWVI